MPHSLRRLGLIAAALSLFAFAPAARADRPTALQATCPPELTLGTVSDCAIAAAGERDTFAFSAKQGERIVVRVRLSTGDLYPEALIRDGAGQPVAGCSASGNTSASFTCALTTGGSFTLDVGDQRGRSTGTYALYAQSLSNPGNARELADWQLARARIDSPIESNVYLIAAAADESVRLRLRRTAGALLPRVTVFDRAGQEVCATSGQPLIELSCTLGEGGDYSLLVDDFHLSSGGDYELLLMRLGQLANPVAIELGRPYDGAISSGLAARAYAFDAQRNDRVMLRAHRRAGNLALRVGVYGPRGALVCPEDGAPRASPGICTVPGDGRYTILVDDQDGASTGEFTLFTQRLNGPTQYRSLSIPQTVPERLSTAGGFHTFSFQARSYDAVTLTVARSDGALSPQIRLYDPAGDEVCSAYGTLFARASGCTLRETGQYTVLVDDVDAQATGAYTLTAACARGSCLGVAPIYLMLVHR